MDTMSAASSQWRWAIQAYSTHGLNRLEAEECKRAHEAQEGCLLVRLLEPVSQVGRDCYRVQAVYEGNGDHPRGWLPDGMRHIMIRERNGRVYL